MRLNASTSASPSEVARNSVRYTGDGALSMICGLWRALEEKRHRHAQRLGDLLLRFSKMRARVAAQIAKSVDISTVPTPRLAKFMARDLGTTV
jgi:hypothetical protein